MKVENIRGERQLLGGESNSGPTLLKKTDMDRHLVAARRYSPLLKSSLCTHCTAIASWHRQQHNSSAFQSHFQHVGCLQHQPGYGLFGCFVKRRSYLSIVLKHLIALHVVTLEHDDGSVEAGDVQTEVICPDFFIRCVREHLETRCLTQKGRKCAAISTRDVQDRYCVWKRKPEHIYWFYFD